MKIKISVIIPIFNREKYIARCLRSLLNQSMAKNNYEIIVINDGSKDGTKNILNLFKNTFRQKIYVIENKKNLGLPASLNKGIRASKGKYIVRVDSDDYVNCNFLLILHMMISLNDEYSGVACDYYLVNNKEKVLRQANCENEPIGCGIMFEKKHMIKVGLYNEDYLINEEKEFRERYVKRYTLGRLSIPLYRYRRHTKNMTNYND